MRRTGTLLAASVLVLTACSGTATDQVEVAAAGDKANPAADDPVAAVEPSACHPLDPLEGGEEIDGSSIEAERITVGPDLFWPYASDGEVVVTSFTGQVHRVRDGSASVLDVPLETPGLAMEIDGELWVTDLFGEERRWIAQVDPVQGSVVRGHDLTVEFPYGWGDGKMSGRTSGTGVGWIDLATGIEHAVDVGGPWGMAAIVGDHLLVHRWDGGSTIPWFVSVDTRTADVAAEGDPHDGWRPGAIMTSLHDACLVVATPGTGDEPANLSLVDPVTAQAVALVDVPDMVEVLGLEAEDDRIVVLGTFSTPETDPEVVLFWVDTATSTLHGPARWPAPSAPHLAVDGDLAWFTHGEDLVAVPLD